MITPNDDPTADRMSPLKHIVRPAVFICLLTITGLSLAYQGWNTRIFNYDLIPHMDDARALIYLGNFPEKGTLTSFGSYTPPGITWLMVIGAMNFSDPRFFEFPGCALLYMGTLLGIFLLGRHLFGTTCAYLAVGLWGLSELGLLFAHSSQARSHPFFYVWMVYWIVKWVEQDNASYLAAALLTWAVGMYVFLEMAPALFIIPIVWLFYRPSVRMAPLFWTTLLGAIIWYPYFRFEASRNFVDFKSQIFRQQMRLSNFSDFWCNPRLAPKSWQTSSIALESGSPQAAALQNTSWRNLIEQVSPLWARAGLILDRLLIANFYHALKAPGVALALLIVMLTAAVLLILQSSASFNQPIKFDVSFPAALNYLGTSALLFAVLVNELTVAYLLSPDGILDPTTRMSIRILQALLLVTGLVIITQRQRIISRRHRLLTTLRGQDTQRQLRVGTFVISLLVPWMILLSMTEVERLERFWWLWPLQVLTLAAAVTYLPLQFGFFRPSMWTSAVVLIILIAPNSLVLARINSWVTEGWSGKDGERIQAIDYIASQIKRAGKQDAAIGYQTYIYRYMASYHGIDPRYKVGADLDLLFKLRHGILNRNKCAEGVSPEDEYRIVQTSTAARDEAARQYIETPNHGRFYLARQFGRYQVFQHD